MALLRPREEAWARLGLIFLSPQAANGPYGQPRPSHPTARNQSLNSPPTQTQMATGPTGRSQHCPQTTTISPPITLSHTNLPKGEDLRPTQFTTPSLAPHCTPTSWATLRNCTQCRTTPKIPGPHGSTDMQNLTRVIARPTLIEFTIPTPRGETRYRVTCTTTGQITQGPNRSTAEGNRDAGRTFPSEFPSMAGMEGQDTQTPLMTRLVPSSKDRWMT